jgi:hypothetical protein
MQGWNSIGSKEMKRLADALRYNRSLVSIELQHNSLAVEGGSILGEVLYDNRCPLPLPELLSYKMGVNHFHSPLAW